MFKFLFSAKTTVIIFQNRWINTKNRGISSLFLMRQTTEIEKLTKTFLKDTKRLNLDCVL